MHTDPLLGSHPNEKTICMDSVQEIGSHYDLHNLYAWGQVEPTLL